MEVYRYWNLMLKSGIYVQYNGCFQGPPKTAPGGSDGYLCLSLPPFHLKHFLSCLEIYISIKFHKKIIHISCLSNLYKFPFNLSNVVFAKSYSDISASIFHCWGPTSNAWNIWQRTLNIVIKYTKDSKSVCNMIKEPENSDNHLEKFIKSLYARPPSELHCYCYCYCGKRYKPQVRERTLPPP